MNTYRKILVAIDFSESSAKALARAADLAAAGGAELEVLHVVTYVPPTYAGVEIPAPYASAEYLQKRAAEHLAEWCAERSAGDYRRIVKTGHAKRVIPESVAETKADLLVLGASGETGLTRVFGSVAGHVTQHAECDVLLVR